MKFRDVRDLYRLQVDAHEHDSARFWAIFNLMSVINGALIAIVVSTDPPSEVKYFLAGFGLLVCLIWFMMQRGFGYLVVCYKIRRSIAARYYMRALLEGKSDDDEIDIDGGDKRSLATQHFARDALKQSRKEASKKLPRFYFTPPPGGEDEPNHVSWLKSRRPGFGSMTTGMWMPVLFGLLWCCVASYYVYLSTVAEAGIKTDAHVLTVENKDDATTIELDVPINKDGRVLTVENKDNATNIQLEVPRSKLSPGSDD